MAGYEEDVSTHLLAMGCAICGRPLRDPTSIQRGWGPECDDKYMFGAGTEAVLAGMEHDFDPEEAAEAIRSAPTIAPTRWVEPTKLARKGEETEDGTVLKGGEVLEGRPLRVPGLREYWEKIGGSADSPRAEWRSSAPVRREMVSKGIWYASRAVTFGYDEDVVSAEKVDPKWLVLASVQRFARAVGLGAVADRMTNFYGAKMRKVVEEKLKAVQKRDAIVFEHSVPASHRTWARGQELGPGISRLHAPYNEQWNALVRRSGAIFFAFEKDPPYFWRYFRQDQIRTVVNMVQECFGDALSITRRYQEPGERYARERKRNQQFAVMDVGTGEVRWLDRRLAPRFEGSSRFQILKGTLK